MHFMIIIFYPHNFGYFVQTLELHNVLWCFGGFFLLCFLVPSFIFIRKRCFNWGWGVWVEFNIVSNFYFFIFGMCIRKEACLFVSLHFCPKNEILISLLRVYCLVEHLVKEMVDLNDACVLDIVYFVEGKCSFLTILFVVSYKTNANNNLRNSLEKVRGLFSIEFNYTNC